MQKLLCKETQGCASSNLPPSLARCNLCTDPLPTINVLSIVDDAQPAIHLSFGQVKCTTMVKKANEQKRNPLLIHNPLLILEHKKESFIFLTDNYKHKVQSFVPLIALKIPAKFKKKRNISQG
jgi:hypothetical protein